MGMEHWWNDDDEKIEVLGEKSVSLPLCPLPSPRGVAFD
jgi:hypothetical protein